MPRHMPYDRLRPLPRVLRPIFDGAVELSKSKPYLLEFPLLDMRSTCFYALHMGAMIQIRNVPEALHRQLKSRAALAGMSLSDYLLNEIRQVAERPTIDELRARLQSRTETAPSVPPAEAIRAARDRM